MLPACLPALPVPVLQLPDSPRSFCPLPSPAQVVGCKDTISQSYLMDCLIQVFPDEFHLASLEAFLDGVCRLKEKVRVRPVLESLMERIGNYVEEHPDTLPRDVRAMAEVFVL